MKSKTLSRIKWAGLRRYCAACGHKSRRFLGHGPYLWRENAKCPLCNSLERHRACAIVYRELPRGRSILHVAPEAAMKDTVSRLQPTDYLSIDLDPERAEKQADVTALDLPSNSWGIIIANHVMEHVQDDAAAFREFHRILKPGGIAALTFPDNGTLRTDEDHRITDPEERRLRWGHPGHVRRYGLDVQDRLEAAGFTVRKRRPYDLLSDKDRKRMGLWHKDTVWLCIKPQEGL